MALMISEKVLTRQSVEAAIDLRCRGLESVLARGPMQSHMISEGKATWWSFLRTAGADSHPYLHGFYFMRDDAEDDCYAVLWAPVTHPRVYKSRGHDLVFNKATAIGFNLREGSNWEEVAEDEQMQPALELLNRLAYSTSAG